MSKSNQHGDVAAFFDLDLTLLSVNSAKMWVKYLWKRGEIGTWTAARSAGWLLRYKFALLDLSEISRKALADLEGQNEEEMRLKVANWYEQELRDRFYQEAIDLIEDHRQKGHRLFLATGSSPYVSAPACKQLGLEDYVCTRLEVVDGNFTGRPMDPVCYGEGKLHWMKQLAQRHNVDLSQSWFYTDSFTDLPGLRAVGHPVATNPDPRLRRLAKREDMTVRDFKR